MEHTLAGFGVVIVSQLLKPALRFLVGVLETVMYATCRSLEERRGYNELILYFDYFSFCIHELLSASRLLFFCNFTVVVLKVIVLYVVPYL